MLIRQDAASCGWHKGAKDLLVIDWLSVKILFRKSFALTSSCCVLLPSLRERNVSREGVCYAIGELSRNGMSESNQLSPELLVADLFKNWPQTIPFFLQRRMGCAGCPMAIFDTLADVACNYAIPLEQMLGDLKEFSTEN